MAFIGNQPVNAGQIVCIRFAEGLRELPLLCSDEDHHACVEKNRRNQIDPGPCQQAVRLYPRVN